MLEIGPYLAVKGKLHNASAFSRVPSRRRGDLNESPVEKAMDTAVRSERLDRE